jgi:hypothetical protein
MFISLQVVDPVARSGSAPPTIRNPQRPLPVSQLVRPRIRQDAEPDVSSISAEQARRHLTGTDRRLIRAVYAAFRFCHTRTHVAEHLDIGALGEEDLRRAVADAVTRGWRFDTLVLLIVKGYPFF